MSDQQAKPEASRRKFLKGAAAATTGAATLGFPMISRGARTTVLKMQGSWGAGDIFNEQAIQYADMVNEMGGGELKIDYLNAGAVVKAFEVQDAVNKGILDAGHLVPAYWYGKNAGFAGMSVTAAQQVLGDAGFGSDAQALHPFDGLQEGYVKLS